MHAPQLTGIKTCSRSAVLEGLQYAWLALTHPVVLQANELIKKLEEDGEEYEEGFYFTAGYDAPFKWVSLLASSSL